MKRTRSALVAGMLATLPVSAFAGPPGSSYRPDPEHLSPQNAIMSHFPAGTITDGYAFAKAVRVHHDGRLEELPMGETEVHLLVADLHDANTFATRTLLPAETPRHVVAAMRAKLGAGAYARLSKVRPDNAELVFLHKLTGEANVPAILDHIEIPMLGRLIRERERP